MKRKKNLLRKLAPEFWLELKQSMLNEEEVNLLGKLAPEFWLQEAQLEGGAGQEEGRGEPDQHGKFFS